MKNRHLLGDWYLREWMAHRGKRQADLIHELGWLKARASKVWNSQISYRRETVHEIAEWLGLQPYELLMRPQDAEALRRLRATAAAIVAEHDVEFEREEEAEEEPLKRRA